MDYVSALVRASAEYPPRWDFSNWTSLQSWNAFQKKNPRFTNTGSNCKGEPGRQYQQYNTSVTPPT